MAWASDLIAIVLASPGTPSTRRCPRASRATNIRSSRPSWPTMVFLTSYSACSSGCGDLGAEAGASVGGVSMALPSALSLRHPGGTAGRGDRDGEPDPDEVLLT